MYFNFLQKSNRKFFITILILFLVVICTGCHYPTPSPTPEGKNTLKLVDTLITRQPVNLQSTPGHNNFESSSDPTIEPTFNYPFPEPTLLSDPFADLYNCQMEVKFISGPLNDKVTSFTVLGRDYFWEKGDKFEAGQGTGVYYQSQHFFILHSSVLNGNIFHDLEAEFLRRYLENWGWVSTNYIQQRIDQLIGSEVVWVCDGKELFFTQVDGVVRLSHKASNRLWLEPKNIPEILQMREGNADEWIGDIPEIDQNQILLGFCGWGPFSLGEERVTYYRYLVSFKVQN